MRIGSSVRTTVQFTTSSLIDTTAVDYEAANLAKSVNQVQKEIAAKKKVSQPHAVFIETSGSNTRQAKENADDLVAKKREIDAQVEAKRKQAREHEAAMRVVASTAGNIVGKAVPVSNTEVSHILIFCPGSSPPRTVSQDDNQVLRTWHPDGPNGAFEKKSGILAHHEVLLRLDAMDLDRGDLPFISMPSPPHSTIHA